MTLSSQASAYFSSTETMNSWPALIGIFEGQEMSSVAGEGLEASSNHIGLVLHHTGPDLWPFLLLL